MVDLFIIVSPYGDSASGVTKKILYRMNWNFAYDCLTLLLEIDLFLNNGKLLLINI